MNSDIGFIASGRDENSMQFERIEEQLREESPTKSERRGDDHQAFDAVDVNENSHRSGFQIRPQEVEQNAESQINP